MSKKKKCTCQWSGSGSVLKYDCPVHAMEIMWSRIGFIQCFAKSLDRSCDDKDWVAICRCVSFVRELLDELEALAQAQEKTTRITTR